MNGTPRHPLTLAGIVLTTMSAVSFLGFFVIDLFGVHANPYLGIVAFIALPAIFVLGLTLIPVGVWLARRRSLRGLGPALLEWPRVDLNRTRTRQVVFAVAVLTPVNFLILSLAAYKGVEAMDSDGFCGQVCHQVMEPEFVAHQSGPHSRVACVTCHIGSGAESFMKAKVNGVHQVYAVLLNTHRRPIPTPVTNMRSAPEVCESCHAPDRYFGEKTRAFREYADDEKNAESVTTVRLKLGGVDSTGVASGIHWHAAPGHQIEYVATDEARQTIPYVRVKAANGTFTEYFAEGTTVPPPGPLRRMDCMDCHNRVSHTFAKSAERAVNEAFAAGALPATLPYLRRESLRLLKASYPTQEEGLRGIAAGVSDFYAREYPAFKSGSAGDIDRAAVQLQAIYRRSVFPSMNISWGSYPNNRGHMEFPGCFRCHDDGHKTREGRAIAQDCTFCHELD